MNVIRALPVLCLYASGTAQAAFVGPYAVENWQCNSSFSCNTSGAPDSVTIWGPGGVYEEEYYEEADPAIISFMFFSAPASGVVSFDWSYRYLETSFSDSPFGYLHNGTFTHVAAAGSAVTASGTTSFEISAGDGFGFGVQDFALFGQGAIVVIDNFSSPSVPLPATAWLFSSGLIGFIGIARRKA